MVKVDLCLMARPRGEGLGGREGGAGGSLGYWVIALVPWAREAQLNVTGAPARAAAAAAAAAAAHQPPDVNTGTGSFEIPSCGILCGPNMTRSCLPPASTSHRSLLLLLLLPPAYVVVALL